MRKAVLTLALGAITLPWAFAQTGAMGKSATGKANAGAMEHRTGAAKTVTSPRLANPSGSISGTAGSMTGSANRMVSGSAGAISGSANRMVNQSGAAANKAKSLAKPVKPYQARPSAHPK
jgi:hypothetical protein